LRTLQWAFEDIAGAPAPLHPPIMRVTRIAATVPALLMLVLAAAPQIAYAVSYEFQVTQTYGLPTEGAGSELTSASAVPGKTAYRLIAKECVHGACETMGINSLAKAKNAVFSSDNIPEDAPFVLLLRLQAQTPEVELKKRVQIVSTARASVRRRHDGVRGVDDMQSVVHVTGRDKLGAVGLLHQMYHIKQKHVAEYLLNITPKELRGCVKRTCSFHTTENRDRVRALPETPIKVAGEQEPVAFEFTLRLHEDSAGSESRSVDNYALAAHFAEHASRWSLSKGAIAESAGNADGKQIVDTTPETAQVDVGLSWSVLSADSRDGIPTSYCPTYKHVATLGGGKGHVWYLDNKVSSKAVPQIVIAFHGSLVQSGGDLANADNEKFDIFQSAAKGVPYLGKVAHQYNKDYKSIANELREFLVPEATVLVTGFSRSSGLATLAAMDLVLDDSIKVSKLYGVTFGSPQVGDISFLRAFRKFVTRSDRFGFFSRIVAADGDSATVKVDPEVLMPGGFNEYLATYPSVKNVDCIRSFADVIALTRTAAGHLSHYVHVGSRVLLFEDGKQTPPLYEHHAVRRASSLHSSKSDVYDLAQSMAPYPATKRMDIYVERLQMVQRDQNVRRVSAGVRSLVASKLSLRKHVAALLRSVPWRTSVRAIADGTLAATRPDPVEGVCEASMWYAQPLTVRLMLGDPGSLAEDERVAVSLCDEKRICHSMLAMSREDYAKSTIPEARSMHNVYYATHRRHDLRKTHLQVSIVKQARSPNCRSSISPVFPAEQVTTHVAKAVKIGEIPGADEKGGLSGNIEIGGLKISFVVRMPLQGDAASAARPPERAILADSLDHPYHQRQGSLVDDSQEQIVEAVEGVDDSGKGSSEVTSAETGQNGDESADSIAVGLEGHDLLPKSAPDSPGVFKDEPESPQGVVDAAASLEGGVSSTPQIEPMVIAEDKVSPLLRAVDKGDNNPRRLRSGENYRQGGAFLPRGHPAMPGVAVGESNTARYPDRRVSARQAEYMARRTDAISVSAHATGKIGGAQHVHRLVQPPLPDVQTGRYFKAQGKSLAPNEVDNLIRVAGRKRLERVETANGQDANASSLSSQLQPSEEPRLRARVGQDDRIEFDESTNYLREQLTGRRVDEAQPSRLLRPVDGSSPTVSAVDQEASTTDRHNALSDGSLVASAKDSQKLSAAGVPQLDIQVWNDTGSDSGAPVYDPDRVPSSGKGYTPVSEATQVVAVTEEEQSGAGLVATAAAGADVTVGDKSSQNRRLDSRSLGPGDAGAGEFSVRSEGGNQTNTSGYDPDREPTGGKGYEPVEEASRQASSVADGSASETMNTDGVDGHPKTDMYRYEIGSNLLPMQPSNSSSAELEMNSPVDEAQVELLANGRRLIQDDAALSESVRPFGAIDKPEPPKRAAGQEETTCPCAVGTTIDCATPVPGEPGKCTLQLCLKASCEEQGPLRCVLSRTPTYTISETADLENIGINDEVDCKYEEDVLTLILQ
jgi:Lipase (class 3)